MNLYKTLGPWEIGTNENNSFRIMDGDGVCVAVTYGRIAAEIIAAAPVMLAALEAIASIDYDPSTACGALIAIERIHIIAECAIDQCAIAQVKGEK